MSENYEIFLIITLIYWLLCLAGKTSDELREATVNIIENIECSSYLNGNTTNHAIRRATVKQTLPNGINSQLICSTGIRQEDGVYTVNLNYEINDISAEIFYLIALKHGMKKHFNFHFLKGPCEGDSGGPLFIDYGSGKRKRQTLEGITSGGLSCGQNFPSWYTRVSILTINL